MTNLHLRMRRWLGVGLLLPLVGAITAGCGGGQRPSAHASRSLTTIQTSTVGSIQQGTAARPANPYRLLSLTRKEVEAKNFVLGAKSGSGTVRITKSEAIEAELKDFPSRVAPRRITTVLIRCESLDRKLNPPYHRFIPVWAVVLGARFPEVPVVVSSRPVPIWTVVLINANTGNLQEVFERRGSKRHSG
jgi:hypothetical protein